jgi:hypothetical protein
LRFCHDAHYLGRGFRQLQTGAEGGGSAADLKRPPRVVARGLQDFSLCAGGSGSKTEARIRETTANGKCEVQASEFTDPKASAQLLTALSGMGFAK